MLRKISSGQKLWRDAKRKIAGGTMLLSKHPDLYLPGSWPSYYKSAHGIKIEDLDGNFFQDFTNMSVGACMLGYSNPRISNAVHEACVHGVMTTLLNPREVELAEKLLLRCPWADLVKFARTGGESLSIAVRLARSFTRRNKVVVAGYHGWHDWYLSAQLESQEITQKLLLDGLEIGGVPRELLGSAQPVLGLDVKVITQLIRQGDVAAVVIEIARSSYPSSSTLLQIREICDEFGVVLIVDECTTGFRENGGGLYEDYGLVPDICIFAKALGNGHPVTAIVGQGGVMSEVCNTFVSSTFWTDSIGTAAALETLSIIEQDKSYMTIVENGRYIKKKWQELSNEYNLKIKISGLDSMPEFSFENYNINALKAFIAQEMLQQGYLASNKIYLSSEHTRQEVDKYLLVLSSVFKELSTLDREADLRARIPGGECHSSFKRLN